MKSSTRKTTLVLLLASLFAVAGMWAQTPGTGTVKGTLKKGTVAVAGARITIESAASSSYTAVATTDATGAYSVTGTPLGGIDVKAYDTEGKLLTSSKSTVRTAGQIVTVNLTAK